MRTIKKIMLSILMASCTGSNIGAMEEHPGDQSHTPAAAAHLTTRAMRPEQMIAANIYNSNDICPICQEELGKVQPIIAIHCAPDTQGCNGVHHAFHAGCIREWWQSVQRTGQNKTCANCKRAIPENIHIADNDPITMQQIVVRQLKNPFIYGSFLAIVVGNVINCFIRDRNLYPMDVIWYLLIAIFIGISMEYLPYLHNKQNLFRDLSRYFHQTQTESPIFNEGGVIELQ